MSQDDVLFGFRLRVSTLAEEFGAVMAAVAKRLRSNFVRPRRRRSARSPDFAVPTAN
jgi:hypothetical protein